MYWLRSHPHELHIERGESERERTMLKLNVLAPLFGLCFGLEFPEFSPNCLDVTMREPVCKSGVVLEAERPNVTFHDDAVLFWAALQSVDSGVVVPVVAVADSGWFATDIGLTPEIADQLGLRPQRYQQNLWEASGDRITAYSPQVVVSIEFQLPNRTHLEVTAVAGNIGSTAQLPHPFVFIGPRMLKNLELSLVMTAGGAKAVMWCHIDSRFRFSSGARVQVCEEKNQGQDVGLPEL
mmetsp:Transcript_64123/g.134810  ORF Transcript_64123/g.134810 Transcript_64123/m.134810 type:complete len:238 (+) Transcript_64123:6-719(+)